MTAVEILTAMADPEQGEYRGALVEEVLAYLDHGMRDEWDCGLDEKEMWGPSELQIAAKSALSLAIYHEEKPEVEIKDYTADYPGIKPALFWCVANQTNEVALCQGFKGIWQGRESDWYFPQMGYTSAPPFVYKSKAEAIQRALTGDFGIQKRLEKITKTVDQIELLAATDTKYDVLPEETE